jgi:hypothetical protein
MQPHGPFNDDYRSTRVRFGTVGRKMSCLGLVRDLIDRYEQGLFYTLLGTIMTSYNVQYIKMTIQDQGIWRILFDTPFRDKLPE